jgi:hypothetical protein
MTVTFAQDVWTLDSNAVQPVEAGGAYPYDRLELGDQLTEHQIPVIEIANAFTQLTIAPTLGGRIVGWFDKRADQPVIPIPTKILLVEGGHRGVVWNHGIEFLTNGDQLSPVDFRIIEPVDPESSGAILLFDWDGDRSWHWAITLNPDSALPTIEQKSFNRSWRAQVVPCGVRIHHPVSLIDADEELRFSVGMTSLAIPSGFPLGGRRTVAWRTQLAPIDPAQGGSHCAQASVVVNDDRLGLQAHSSFNSMTVFVSVGNQTMESQWTSRPGVLEWTDLSSVGQIEAVALRDQNLAMILEWPCESRGTSAELKGWNDLSDDQSWQNLVLTPGFEAEGWFKRSRELLNRGDLLGADEALDKVLGFNAEDPLIWWYKAALRREHHLGNEEEPRILPNAHFLAPLEPLLKCEAFLRFADEAGSEPNPLLEPIAFDPMAASGCVAAYLDHNMVQSAIRIGNEILRHHDQPLVRILIASAFLDNDRFAPMAAELIQNLPETARPPYPFRLREIQAFKSLLARFPTHPGLVALKPILECRPN